MPETPPPHQMGRHQCDLLGQEAKRARGEKSPPHPDSSGRAPQPGCWPRSLWLLVDYPGEECGGSRQHVMFLSLCDFLDMPII